MDLVIEADRVAITLQQDGTTDWIVGRAAPGAIREAITAGLAFVSAPVDLLKAAFGLKPVKPDAPSDTHGCEGLLED